MAEESDGTNSYFKLIGIVKEVLDEGTPLVVDELDAHLHPLLTKHLVSLFNSVEFNPNGAQLIFTSHNTNLLDLDVLRRDQIWFAEKDELTAATDLFSLQAFSIRKDTKLEKGYLIGHYDALYDLLGSLSIIPTSGPFFLRLASFVKLTLLAHVPVSAARKLFQKDKRTKYEVLVMRLAGQALLSTAEIIKCIDKNISRLPNECALLDSLYGDETTTSDNIASMVKISQSSKPVTLAVANLYLRQQIIFERV